MPHSGGAGRPHLLCGGHAGGEALPGGGETTCCPAPLGGACGWPVLNALGVKPLVQAGMRLGEGTGAVAVMPMLDMAMAVYHGDTFDDLRIEAYTPQSEDF